MSRQSEMERERRLREAEVLTASGNAFQKRSVFEPEHAAHLREAARLRFERANALNRLAAAALVGSQSAVDSGRDA